MKWFTKIALSIMALLTALAVFFAKFYNQRAKVAAAESEAHREAFNGVVENVERLVHTLEETTDVEKKANEERKDLAGTPDSDLVHRANKLF